jgi:hypothetical protein
MSPFDPPPESETAGQTPLTSGADAAGRNMIYTIAFDPPGEPYHQMMAKMLVSSIFRAGFSGKVLILTNCEHRVFEYGRLNVEEMSLDTGGIDRSDLATQAQQFKYRARRFVDLTLYQKVMFVDCDCLFLKNPDDLFERDADLAFSEETFTRMNEPGNNAYFTEQELGTLDKPGINSGIWWVRVIHYDEVMKEWERIDATPPVRTKACGDQPAWARLLRDTQLRCKAFQYNAAVFYPFFEERKAQDFASATVLHYCGVPRTRKVAHMFGEYMRRFHAETTPVFLNFLDG